MKYIINYIKSIFYPTVIETPNSPRTFNFNHEQLEEINAIFDKGDETSILDTKSLKIEDPIATSSKVKIEDLQKVEINAILDKGDESPPTLNINHEQLKEIQDIFTNLF
jgi:Leucine-rich repeat (LRR) protein